MKKKTSKPKKAKATVIGFKSIAVKSTAGKKR